MYRPITLLFYKKRIPVFSIVLLILIFFVSTASIYKEYLVIKNVTTQLVYRLTHIFVDNENMALSVSSKYYELLDKGCQTSPSENSNYGVAIFTGKGEKGKNFSCLVSALDFVNKKSMNLTSETFGKRYFYSPQLNLLYFFSKKMPEGFKSESLDVVMTRGIYHTVTPDYYERLLSNDLKKKGLSSTTIYQDVLTKQKAYTLISYAYDINKKDILGYLYYDHTQSELKENLLPYLKEASYSGISARVVDIKKGGEICFYGNCSEKGLSYRENFSLRYQMAISLNIYTFLERNIVTLILFFLVTVFCTIVFIVSTKKIARNYLKSSIDPLTKTYTRKMIKHIKFSPQSWLILFDANKFKYINDTYGHHVGDEALKKITAIISSVIRKSDVLVRLGGDEFVAHVVADKYTTVFEMAVRIAKSIKGEPLVVDAEKIVLSVSFGIAKFDGSVESTLIKADKEMYQQKFRQRG